MRLTAASAREWLRRWDRQQELYLPQREDRFAAMFDAVAAHVGGRRFRALDLACGPGSLSDRLRRRFPRASIVGLDFDPVLLTLARATQPAPPAGPTWVESDLRRADWTSALPEGRFDVVLSTTALHWLEPPTLRRVHRDLAQRIRSGGLFLNGDEIGRAGDGPRFRDLAVRVRKVDRARRRSARGAEDWNAWWSAIARDPALTDPIAERAVRFPSAHGKERPVPLEEQTASLRRAGFREVGVIWQRFDNRVLLAVR